MKEKFEKFIKSKQQGLYRANYSQVSYKAVKSEDLREFIESISTDYVLVPKDNIPIKCWSCQEYNAAYDIRENDGSCPECGAEVFIDEGIANMIGAIKQSEVKS